VLSRHLHLHCYFCCVVAVVAAVVVAAVVVGVALLLLLESLQRQMPLLPLLLFQSISCEYDWYVNLFFLVL